MPGGSSDLTLDFGYFQKVTIGDFVWNDTNANGLQDSGEPGIVGVKLTLSNGDTATTDSTGHYLFTENPGTYTVTVNASNFAAGDTLRASYSAGFLTPCAPSARIVEPLPRDLVGCGNW